jgi:hypothetical protein
MLHYALLLFSAFILNDAEFPASATIKESPETIDHKDFIG